MEAKFVAGVDHCLEGLFCIVRYRGHPGAEAAKARCWELGLPGEGLQVAVEVQASMPPAPLPLPLPLQQRLLRALLLMSSIPTIPRTAPDPTQTRCWSWRGCRKRHTGRRRRRARSSTSPA